MLSYSRNGLSLMEGELGPTGKEGPATSMSWSSHGPSSTATDFADVRI